MCFIGRTQLGFSPESRGTKLALVPSHKGVRHNNVWAIVVAGGEGTRVRGFLKQLCGGTGLKQFSPIIGRRSMLQHTLDRMQHLVPAMILTYGDSSGRASEGGSIAPAHPLATREHYLPTGQSRYCARYPAAVFIHYPPRPVGHRYRLPFRSTSCAMRTASWTQSRACLRL